MNPPLLILIAGPYRSGTGGDADKIADNLHRLEQAALAVYLRGHMPMIGEWAALPLAIAAGSTAPGDAIAERFLYPASHRLLSCCHAVYRIAGDSSGADADVELARLRGMQIFTHIDQITPVE